MGNTISKKYLATLIVGLLVFQGCIVYGNKEKVSLKSETKLPVDTLSLSLSSFDISNNVISIRGAGFANVTGVKIKSNGVNATLSISSKTNTQIMAAATNALSLVVGSTFELILSSASAQSSFPVTFTLDSMNAQSGQILKYNGTSWAPANLASSQTYLGTWDADQQLPTLTANPNSGDYYIVTVSGDYPNVGDTYSIGDWIIYNGTAWEKVASGLGTKLSTTGGTLTGDLKLDALLKIKGGSNYVTLKGSASLASDIILTLPITVGTSGQVLTTNGSGVLSWTTPTTSSAPSGAAGGDLSGTYPNPTITTLDAAKIANGSVNNTKYQYLSGVTSDIQAQLDAKQAGGNFLTALTGDVTTAAGPGSVAATVAQVGGVTAANIAAGVNLANAATNANTASTTVKRDASGNFSAGTITATLNGTATNVTGVVAVANGGTGSTSLGLNQLLFGNGTSAVNGLTTTATPSVLLSAVTSGAPTWTTSTAGNILKGSVTGVEFGALALSDLPASTLSGTGTAGKIPYYSTASTLANSPISISGSNVGIGTSALTEIFDVQGGNAPASTAGAGISLTAQNATGPSGGTGGTITLTAGTGTAGWPGGYVRVVAVNGQSGGLAVENNMTTSYLSSSVSVNKPARALHVGNSYNANNNGSLITSSAKNSSAITQTAYFGAISVNGAANYSPAFVIGQSTGATSYSENLRIDGATGNVGIGVVAPTNKLEVNGTISGTTISAGTLYTANASINGGATGGLSLSIRNSAADGYSGILLVDGPTSNNQGAMGYANSGAGLFADSMFITSLAAKPIIFGTTATERMRILSGGNIGINNNNPTEKLHVTGNILASGTVVGSSDRRLKKDIRPIEDALKKLDQITGVKYFWIEPELHNEGEQIGVIAQEVEKVFPQAVITGSDGLKAVSYMGLVAPVIQAIKELNAKFQGIFAKMTGVETRVLNLEKENAELKARLLKIEEALKTK